MGNDASTQEAESQLQAPPPNGKLQNGGVNGHVVSISSKGEAGVADVPRDSELPTKESAPPSPGPRASDGLKKPKPVPPRPAPPGDSGAPAVVPDGPPAPEGDPGLGTEGKVKFFDKLFKKKNEDPVEWGQAEVDSSAPGGQNPADPVSVAPASSLYCEPGNATTGKGHAAPPPNGTPTGSKAPNVGRQDAQPEETGEGESPTDQNPVMNFFKTLVTPTKAPKEEGTPPDVPSNQAKGSRESDGKGKAEKGPPPQAGATAPSTSEPKDPDPNAKDTTAGPFSKLFRQKSFKETQPTTTNGVQEVDAATAAKAVKSAPPAEPPKTETKGEPAAKAAKSSQKEVPKDAPGTPEVSAKPKPAKDSPFGKFFGKTKNEEAEPQPEEGQGGDSKASTLEAPVQPEQPPKQEEKKKSNFLSRMKSKVPQASRAPKAPVVSACGNSVPVSTDVPSPEVKAKPDGPPEAPPLPEVVPSAKVKEEPKPVTDAEKKKSGKQEAAPKAKGAEVAPDNRSAPETSQSGDDPAAGVGRKLEKRNSIHMFFKSLSPKRQSDAVVQTDPVTITYPSEKAK